MNEEAMIQRLMNEQNVTREQAIYMIENNLSEMPQQNALFPQNGLNGVQTSNTQQPLTVNGGSNDFYNPYLTEPLSGSNEVINAQAGVINWNLLQDPLGTNQTPQIPQQWLEGYKTYNVENPQPTVDVTGGGNGAEVVLSNTSVENKSNPTTDTTKDNKFGDLLGDYLFNMNPYGMDMQNALYTAGKAFATNPETQGGKIAKTASIVGGLGKATLEGTRSFLAGNSTQNATNNYWEWMKKRRERQRYENNSQTENTQATRVGGVKTS